MNAAAARAEIYVLFSSSKGNCCLVKNGADVFLIDAGASAKRIFAAIGAVGVSPSDLRAVFLTHEHSDHIAGLNTLVKTCRIPVFAPSGCFDALRRACPDAVPFLHTNDPHTVVELENTRVYAVRTPHDAAASVGFRMELGEECFGYFTDIGHLSADVLHALSGCRRVVLESNHDPDMLKYGPYPASLKRRIASPYGHLSNTDCAALLPHLADYGTQRVVLAHLSEHNNTPEKARAESEQRLQSKASRAVASPHDPVEV